jgi:hypothetical protein
VVRYRGRISNFSVGMVWIAFLSSLKCEATISGGSRRIQLFRETSLNSLAANISRVRRSVSPVFSKLVGAVLAHSFMNRPLDGRKRCHSFDTLSSTVVPAQKLGVFMTQRSAIDTQSAIGHRGALHLMAGYTRIPVSTCPSYASAK